jgi:hypothetical protein
MAGPNPFLIPIKSYVGSLIALATDEVIQQRTVGLPAEKSKRPEAIRRSFSLSLVEQTAETSGVDGLRITPRWFEDPDEASPQLRFVPSEASGAGGHQPSKTSACVSVGGPIKGVGACLSVGD